MRWLVYCKQVYLSYWYYIIHDKQNKKGKIEQDICRYTQTGVPSPTRQGRRCSGAATTDHGSGPPRTGPEPPRAGPEPLYKWKPDLQEARVIELAKGPGPSTLFG